MRNPHKALTTNSNILALDKQIRAPWFHLNVLLLSCDIEPQTGRNYLLKPCLGLELALF